MPGFTVVAALTLAIGIGANTAIFSVIESVLLEPLPYPRSEELVVLDHAAPGVNLTSAGAAPFQYFTYREEGRVFQDVGLWNTGTVERHRPRRARRSASALRDGRRPADARRAADARPRVHEGRRHAGHARNGRADGRLLAREVRRRPPAIGRTLMLDGQPREIIGVLPDTFRFLDRDVSLVVPYRFDRSKVSLGQFSYQALARLKPGVTIAQASADVARLIPISLTRFPPFPGASLKLFQEARLAPNVRSLKDDLVGDVRTVLWVLMGTIGMVLLIACANVANLLLVRAESRQQELAIRAALGAGTGRIARELLLESVDARPARRADRSGAGIRRAAPPRDARAGQPAAPRGHRARRSVAAVHTRAVGRCRASLRRHPGVQVRSGAARPRSSAAEADPQAQAGNAIGRATCWPSCRSRWRSCCWSARD